MTAKGEGYASHKQLFEIASRGPGNITEMNTFQARAVETRHRLCTKENVREDKNLRIPRQECIPNGPVKSLWGATTIQCGW